MPQIATWIRENDEPLFARFFEGKPLELRNARRDSFDLAPGSGLLLTGGPDISADFLNEPDADPALIREPDPVRDTWEFGALQFALGRGLPIFCVCKGMQVLNVALGGSLHLHIEGHSDPEQRDQNIQELRFAAGVRHQIGHVNSSHHQALNRVAPDLAVEAWAAGDDIIEQVRLRNYPFALGVQFHPERDWIYAPLFEEFASEVLRAAK